MTAETGKMPDEVAAEVRERLLEDITKSRKYVGHDDDLARQLQDRDCELDEGDVAEGAVSRDELEGASRRTWVLLTESLAALARLDAGEYGSCELCGGHIGLERLQAIPRTRTCIDCQHGRGR